MRGAPTEFAKRGITTVLILMWSCAQAWAQQPSLSHEDLTVFKEPLAFELRDTTITVEGIVDLPVVYDHDGPEDFTGGVYGGLRLGMLNQLPDASLLSVYYVAEYDYFDGTGKFEDQFSVSLNNKFGTLSAGNVSSFLSDTTGSRVGVGHADLAYSMTLGKFSDYSVNFLGITGPITWGGTIDEEGSFDAGILYQRPLDDFDHRYGLRYSEAIYAPGGTISPFDTRAIEGLAELTYGSSIMDVGFLYEQLDNDQALNLERWGVSSGFRTKSGALTWSVEGHYGQLEGMDEVSAALGMRYDLARGMSVNLGVNHHSAYQVANGNMYVPVEDTKSRASFRYEF